jgi:hypothetical protein
MFGLPDDPTIVGMSLAGPCFGQLHRCPSRTYFDTLPVYVIYALSNEGSTHTQQDGEFLFDMMTSEDPELVIPETFSTLLWGLNKADYFHTITRRILLQLPQPTRMEDEDEAGRLLDLLLHNVRAGKPSDEFTLMELRLASDARRASLVSVKAEQADVSLTVAKWRRWGPGNVALSLPQNGRWNSACEGNAWIGYLATSCPSQARLRT